MENKIMKGLAKAVSVAFLLCQVNAFHFQSTVKSFHLHKKRNGILFASTAVDWADDSFSHSQVIHETRNSQSLYHNRNSVDDVTFCLEALRKEQRKAAIIAESFQPSQFKPIPWLTNPHFQTLAGLVTRDLPECAYIYDGDFSPAFAAICQKLYKVITRTYSPADYWDRRERINTPDGDWFHADYKTIDNAKGLVILLHGLEAQSKSALATDMAEAYRQAGMDVICLNFRGCSGEPNDTLGAYHFGFTSDLKFFLSLLKTKLKQLPTIYLSGFSLGGNVVLKALGELGTSAFDEFNIQGAAVACPPLDQEREIQHLDSPGFNRLVYVNTLLGKFRQKVSYQLDNYCGGDENTSLFDWRGVRDAQCMSDFDSAFVAPVYGFRDKIDYYRKNSSIYFLEKITVPTFVVRSGDDPLFDPDVFPFDLTSEFGGRAPVKILKTEHGGHLGFAFHQEEGISLGDARSSQQHNRAGAWMPNECARFISHVHSREGHS